MRPFCAVDCENVLRELFQQQKNKMLSGERSWWDICLVLQLDKRGIKIKQNDIERARVDTCVFPHSTRVQECVRDLLM